MRIDADGDKCNFVLLFCFSIAEHGEFMNAVIIAILCLLLAVGTFAQQDAASPEPTPPAETSENDLDQVMAIADVSQRATALEKFRDGNGEHPRLGEALEALVIARASLADETLRGGNTLAGIALFKQTVREAPRPAPDRLFGDVLAKIPANLFYLGYGTEALEVASQLETIAEENPAQLLMLSNFYISIENGDRAIAVAEKAIELAPEEAAPHKVLGMARRLNFDVAGAAAAYEKAVELAPNDPEAIRSLADMRRANGDAAEASELYARVLTTNENDPLARAGSVLSLFESGKTAEAEAELAAALERDPKNLTLLAGAAYRFAATGNGSRAIEFARRAIEIEPRYIWSHIALARGQMLEGRPVEAERTLIAARRYGNFPTLDHEVATARIKAGFFREAAEELANRFTIADGIVSTKIGGRVESDAESLEELIAPERRASILSPDPAGDAEASRRLVYLARLVGAAEEGNGEAAAWAAEEFAGGDDEMAIHRRLFAASVLLDKKLAVESAAAIVEGATGQAEAGMKAANPSAAVMAGELYEPRKTALLRGEFLVVPEVPSRTLLAILRGRIEELSARVLIEQGDPENAIVRLRRAISVLPPDSAWWRSGKWRLGDLLLADGKEQEALDQYVAAYDRTQGDRFRYIAIEGLYRRVNGSVEGLEEKIGPPPAGVAAPETTVAEVEPEPETEATAEPLPADPETEDPVEEPVDTESTDSPVPAVEETDPPAENVPAEVVREEEATVTETVAEEPPAVEDETLVTEEETIEETEVPAEEVEADGTETPPTLSNEEEAAFAAPQPLDVAPEPDPEPTTADPTVEADIIDDETKSEPVPETIEEIDDLAAVTTDDGIEREAAEADHPAETISNETSADDAPASLFEPIVITVPTRKRLVPATELAATDEEASGNPPSRPRRAETEDAAETPCSISLSQENISLINNGGTVGLIVTVSDETAIDTLEAISSSAKDIRVKLEPQIVGVGGRAFFVVTSLSERTGVYQITFKASCGSRDVIVRVR